MAATEENDWETPLSEVKSVVNGQFLDSDGSLYVLPLDVCRDLDDDCAVEIMGTNEDRFFCSVGGVYKGRCPFVAD